MKDPLRYAAVALVSLLLAILVASPVRAAGLDAFQDSPAWSESAAVISLRDTAKPGSLVTRGYLGDSITSFEFRADKGVTATLFVQGRYAVPLAGNGEWQTVTVRFRAPRFDDARNKTEDALALAIRAGADQRRNVIWRSFSDGTHANWEDSGGQTALDAKRGPFALRNFEHRPADFSRLTLPKESGGVSNEAELVDFVALGKDTFDSVGCSACHRVAKGDAAVTSGPNLFGLIQPEPRNREVAEGGEGHRFNIKAGREYLHRSVRAPADQLAVAEEGATKGLPYQPVMPAFSKEVLSDQQIDAIGDYLATLNEPYAQGPVVKLQPKSGAEAYDPLADRLQWLVSDEGRLQRGPIRGVSARSIHVGNPSGVNYTFDPRLLAIVKIWQGGFLDMTGELTNRGGNGLALGYESREIGFGNREFLLAPLNASGKSIDFSFKEARFGDVDTPRKALYGKEEQLAKIAAVGAQFLGYSRNSADKLAAPAFKYRVGTNVIEVTTTFSASGEVSISINGPLATAQSFALNTQLLRDASVSAGSLKGDRWSLPAGTTSAVMRGRIAVAASAWRPAPSTYAFKRSPLVTAPAKAKLPAGYSIENYYAPKDNYGRDQLFEALGLALASDGTVVVATRTAGIWRLVNGEWRQFAEGLIDSLGVVVEDNKGLVVVVGQKAELTRISDTNGDGVADRYETLFDAHSYHGNYHTYMHGPVRGKDGAYYFVLNLAADGGNTTYNAGGAYMGTWGGFNGWAVRVQPDGKFELFANGLRSPASLGVGPDGRLWYADNQGEYVGTSKLFELRKDRFYGHPAGLVDLPGMTPDSPEIKWERWIGRKEAAVVLFPHNRVANSPGNPTWVTAPKFGPFVGQMLIGDQTQSNLLRVALQTVDGVEQGSVMPFMEGLESGVMRPMFLADGSLLLGQTGRGWQAKGGKVASLQHVRWDGVTIAPAIVAMNATDTGFRVELTQPLGNVSTDALRAAIKLDSWTYRDAPDYGSDELGRRDEGVRSISIAPDRKSVTFELATLDQPKVHPVQTARVYHLALAAGPLFGGNAPAQLEAYYSLRQFPGKP